MALESWNFDTSHSTVGFSVRHMVIAKVRGRFARWQGKLSYDADAIERSTVSVEIETASIDTNEAQRDGHLRSPDFLDAEKYPKILFASRRVERVGKNELRVVGDLTIHGTSREVTLDVELGGRVKDPWGNDRIGIAAKTRIDRREFGLVWNQALETGGVIVSEHVDIDLEIEATRAQAQATAAAQS